MTVRAAIADVYRQVQAPGWAAPNLDGLADVLRDLSWLPPGPVTVRFPAGEDGLAGLRQVLAELEAQTAAAPHPVHVVDG